MVTLSKLQTYLDDLLFYDRKIDIYRTDPHMANGLHIKGTENITKIGLAVSASIKTFEMAVSAHCQAVIVHHTISQPPFLYYDRLFQNRMAFLIKNNLSLFGYHFLLDSHPLIGHNIEILKQLDVQKPKPFAFDKDPWGFFGEIEPADLTTIIDKIKPFLSPTMKLYDFGPKKIKTIAAVSGHGVPYPSNLTYFIKKNIDLYITGENSEWIREIFRESGINYLAGGHYYTERYGLLALERKIKNDLAVNTEFLEFTNEV